MKAIGAMCVAVMLTGSFAGCAETRAPDDGGPAWWSPDPGSSWQLQLRGTIDTGVDVEVFEIDGLDTPASKVTEIHDRGARAICYFSAGTFEDWRTDAGSFSEEVLGDPLPEWPGERWLDIRQLGALEPIIAERLDICAEKGFDAVDPDNLDGYANDSGFPLSYDDQIRYNRMVARLAHEHGLGVGLKNDLDQVASLVGDFDFAVNEQCVQYEECELLDPFVSAGKAVLHVEYEPDPAELCGPAERDGFSTIHKHLDLGKWRSVC